MPLRKERHSLAGESTYKIKERERRAKTRLMLILADFREREEAFKEKKHKDLYDLKEGDLILRENFEGERAEFWNEST